MDCLIGAEWQDEQVIKELKGAGIFIDRLPNIPERHLVKTGIRGRLGSFKFTRDVSRWIVCGMMPLDTAKHFHEHEGVRVAGQDKWPPVPGYIRIIDENGYFLHSREYWDEFDPEGAMRKRVEANLSNRLVDDPEKEGRAFVFLFEIFSLEALVWFVEQLKALDLVPRCLY